jgi:hypothetical protein
MVRIGCGDDARRRDSKVMAARNMPPAQCDAHRPVHQAAGPMQAEARGKNFRDPQLLCALQRVPVRQ